MFMLLIIECEYHMKSFIWIKVNTSTYIVVRSVPNNSRDCQAIINRSFGAHLRCHGKLFGFIWSVVMFILKIRENKCLHSLKELVKTTWELMFLSLNESLLYQKKKHNMPILFLSLQTMVITPESCWREFDVPLFIALI